MWPLLPLLALLAAPTPGATSGEAPPSVQATIYYNARMALRDERPTEALRLWLLRNAVEQRSGQVSAHDEDFRSVVWAALGALGLCPDGFPGDASGAGLWPVAQHNWLVYNMRRADSGGLGDPFTAFSFGRQQRHVSLHDVLDADELKTVRFRRAGCWLHGALLIDAGELPFAELRDRQVSGRVMRHLLRGGLERLDSARVVGRSVLLARIFDINLKLNALSRRASRRAQRQQRREAREAGLPREALAEEGTPKLMVELDSEEGRILRESLSWPPEEWMSLSPARRLFLFGQAALLSEGEEALKPLALGVIERLVEARQGAEVQSWIAHLTAKDEAARPWIWSGPLGRQLMALERETGFRERGVIALHRGVEHLGAGRLPEALRALAHALSWAEASSASERVRNLARRWLSFVASQFRVTDELFAMLKSVVPRTDYNVILEDQLWHAALSADLESFERCARHLTGRGSVKQRAAALAPLARGDADVWLDEVKAQLEASPHVILRFLKLLMARLQLEAAPVRLQYVPVLRRLQVMLAAHNAAEGRRKSQRRRAEAIIADIRAMREGMTGLDSANDADKAATLSPSHEVFAGSVRVAPTDPLPWPFAVAEVDAPPVFMPIKLRPEEWRQPDGRLVFGWRISD